MKKIVFGILSLLLITPVFADSYMNQSDYNFVYELSTSSGDNFYYSLVKSNYGKYQGIYYGLGKYIDNYNFSYYDFSGNLYSGVVYNCSSTNNCQVASVYAYGFNNGNYVNLSDFSNYYGSLTFSQIAGNKYFNALGSIKIGLDSNGLFNGNLYYKIPSQLGNYGVVLNQNSSNNISFSDLQLRSRFIRYFSEYNLYNYWDNHKFNTNYGVYNDIPDGCSRLAFTTLSDGGYSFIYNCSGNILFKTIAGVDINYTFYDEFSSVKINDINRDYLFFHLNDYSSEYLSGKLSIVLSNTSSGIIYNIYPFVSSVNQLSGLPILKKGYLNGNLSNIYGSYNLPIYFDTFGLYSSYLNIRSYFDTTCNGYGNVFCYPTRLNQFQFIEDDSVGIINLSGSKSSEDNLLENIKDSLEVSCKFTPWNPLCNGGQFNINSGTDISFVDDGSGNISVVVTLYDTEDEDCPDMYFTGSNGQVFHQYFNRVCLIQSVLSSSDSSPEFGLDDFSDSGHYTQLISGAFVGILSGFNIHQCPFRSPFGVLRLGTIGGMGSFLLDKFFDVNIIGPFSCLLGGVLYSTSDSQSISNQLVHHDGEKFLNSWSDQSKQYLNYLLMALIVILFRRFRPNSNSDH